MDADDNWNEPQFLSEAKNFQLVYIFSHKPLTIQNPEIKEIETKTVFEKELVKNPEADSVPIASGIRKVEGKLSPELESLALQSGSFSRFKVDSRLHSEEFEKLYKLWIQKSVENDLVLVSENNSGFVTCSIESDVAQIGLIAVDQSQRGKGLGQQLIQVAENYAFSNGAKKMKIGTQEANHPACALYSKLGYKVVEKLKVWHYWSTSPVALPHPQPLS